MHQIKKIDTIVVGAGLAGSMLSHQLKMQGIDFVLFDAGSPRSSDVAAGIFNPIVFRRLLKTWMADELIPYTHQFYDELEKERDASFYHPMKHYKILSNEESDFWLKRSVLEDTNPYLNPSIQFPDHYEQIYHPYGLGEVFYSGWVDINAMLNQVREQYREEQILIEEYFDYRKLVVLSSEISYGDYMARRVIFCEGNGIAFNPWFNYIPFKPTKGEVLTFRCEGLNLDSIINKNGFILPLGNNLYKAGATYEWANLTPEPTEAGKAQLLKIIDTIVKLPYTIVKHEAGIRPASNDRRPVLGKHPWYENLIIFNGLGTKGIMLAPYFAKHLTEHLFNGQMLNTEVDANRFNKYYREP